MRGIWFAVRTGLLDMRRNLRRFTLVVVCLAVGTALVAGVTSVGASITETVERNAATVMGGDVQVSRAERPATPEQLAALMRFGKVAGVVDTNVTASAGDLTAFVDLAAVGPNYPLLGQVASPQLPSGVSPYDFLSFRDGMLGALVDPLMLDALKLKPGDTIVIGGTPFEVRGVLDSLPDGAVRGFRLGRLAAISAQGLEMLGDRTSPLPGLGTWFRYKVLLDGGEGPEAGRAAIGAALGDASWTVQTARDSLGPMVRYYDLFMRFLLIVGLSALLVGGVGVSNSMTAYVAEQSNTVAILRSLGAGSTRVFLHFFSQIACLALVGVAIGLVAGGALSLVAVPIVGDAIGVPLPSQVHAVPLLGAAAIGLLTAFAFGYLPLQQAQTIPPAILFRTRGLAARPLDWPALVRSPKVLPLLVAIALLAWMAVIVAGDARLVGAFALVCAVAVAIFRLALWVGTRLLQRSHAIPNRLLRHALRDVAGPGSTAPSVVISVGLVVATLIMVQVLGINLRNEYLGASVFDAPSFVASDIFPDEAETIASMQKAGTGIADFAFAPMLRGAVSAVNGVPVDRLTPSGSEASFLLSGDIPLTYRTGMPSTSRLVEGDWWPADYHGPLLVSLHQKLRSGLGLKLGDSVTFTIFGDEVTARVANFRDYSWQGGIDFLVTFSPGALEAYPATLLAAVTAAPGQEDSVERQLAAALPDVRFIAIGETLVKITAALGQLSLAVLAVGGLAVGNGLLTLLGSLAAGRQQRRNDAVVTKVLGATRGQVLAVSILRYAVLAAFAAVLATPIGIGLAWVISSMLLEVEFTVHAGMLATFDVVAVVLTGLLGATTILTALTVPPAMLLRQMGVR